MNSSLVRRFVAGVTLRDALLVVKEYGDNKITGALDLLGENVLNPEEAARATDGYLEVIRQISIFSPSTHISIKLTALGLDISEQLARDNLRKLIDEARSRGGIFIRVDMEGSAYTAKTLQIVCEEHRKYENIGTVVQSYLRRTDKDLESLIKERISVRLVKGAYAEPPSIAFPKKTDVDAAYRKQMRLLLDKGHRPAIATQDETMIKIARQYIKQNNIAVHHADFEMLMGVRRDLQDKLVQDGYHVRVYIPFGIAWYPYFTRRLAERPANIWFFMRNLVKK
jgi:proline dehydrogenase